MNSARRFFHFALGLVLRNNVHCRHRKHQATTKGFTEHAIQVFALLISLLFLGTIHATCGGIAVSADGSTSASRKGCMLAFLYRQDTGDRLVVVDEPSGQRYDALVKNGGLPPFWDEGKLYVIEHSGKMQEFLFDSNAIAAKGQETISTNVIFTAQFDADQRRLYLIETVWNSRHTTLKHDLVAIDFPARKTLWRKQLDTAGLLTTYSPHICVMGPDLIEIFNCDTGEKIGLIETAKPAPSGGSNTRK